ncbi:hypothetical protein [Rhizobium leguminosarum]|uniref:hypothetical protein n=1 Tax=Rhizobium leguminosarum TaxID=384 RepID=UPI00103A1B7B|nr:hypothetical protein [Rhizobium leguminosarum]TBZ82647.1 hypothetical protein E0H61_13020 [Rhizobium leguminosarum bv. viciae]TBZ89041.1 hypothetical protein E0H56_23495 [Rhizobium leguminosarum bv. viciae]
MEQSIITDCMEEIRTRLGGILAKLGVEACLHERRDGFEVFFQNSEQKLFSPVWIWFARDERRDTREASWDDAQLVHDKYKKRKLRDTGYWNQRMVDEDSYPISLRGSEMFEWIRNKLRSAGTLSAGTEDSTRVYSDLLADIYWSIKTKIPDLGVTHVDHDDFPGEKPMGFEALTFLDHEGRRIHIAHQSNSHAIYLLVDGERVAEFRKDDATTLAKCAVRMSKGHGLDNAELGLR